MVFCRMHMVYYNYWNSGSLQCFKFATLAFWPFGKEIVYGNGMFSFLVNLIWDLPLSRSDRDIRI